MVIIGSDHTGIELKKQIIAYLQQKNISVKDVTDYEDQTGDDYPDIAWTVCKNVLDNECLGIAICGTGIGISIACNKINGIRAAVCTNEYMAKMTRADNNANVLCLGSRLVYDNIFSIVDVFLTEQFSGDRHQRRLDKIEKIEQSQKDGVDYGDSV